MAKVEAANDEDVWIGAREAVNRLSAFAGSDRAAKALIQDRLRDKQLHVRATRYIEVEERGEARMPIPTRSSRGIEVYWGNKPTRDETDVEVSTALWAKSVDWDGDTSSWNWGDGVFFVSFRPGRPTLNAPLMRAKLGGAQFLAAEILQISGGAAAITNKGPEQSTSGLPRGRGRGAVWNTWVAELAAFIIDGDFKPGMSSTVLLDLIDQRLASRGAEVPKPGLVTKAAQAVLGRLGER
jgi:hypothetical protein